MPWPHEATTVLWTFLPNDFQGTSGGVAKQFHILLIKQKMWQSCNTEAIPRVQQLCNTKATKSTSIKLNTLSYPLSRFASVHIVYIGLLSSVFFVLFFNKRHWDNRHLHGGIRCQAPRSRALVAVGEGQKNGDSSQRLSKRNKTNKKD